MIFFSCLDLSLKFSLQVYNKPCTSFPLQELQHIHASVVHALPASRLSLRTTSWRSRLLLPGSSYLSCFLFKPGGKVLPWRVTPECSLHVLCPETFNTELRFFKTGQLSNYGLDHVSAHLSQRFPFLVAHQKTGPPLPLTLWCSVLNSFGDFGALSQDS